MRHFGYLSAAQVAALFERPPERFDRGSGTDLLSVALGATLYMPADRPSLVADITKQAAAGVTSVVVCLEDAIADEQVGGGRGQPGRRVLRPARASRTTELPLLFVRVRDAAQIPALVRRLGKAAHLLDGFVLPKFTALSGTEYLLTLEAAEREAGVVAAGDAGDRVRRCAVRRDPGRRAHPPPRAAAPRPAAHPRGPHRRHRPVRALRPAPLPGAVHLRHQGRLRR